MDGIAFFPLPTPSRLIGGGERDDVLHLIVLSNSVRQLWGPCSRDRDACRLPGSASLLTSLEGSTASLDRGGGVKLRRCVNPPNSAACRQKNSWKAASNRWASSERAPTKPKVKGSSVGTKDPLAAELRPRQGLGDPVRPLLSCNSCPSEEHTSVPILWHATACAATGDAGAMGTAVIGRAVHGRAGSAVAASRRRWQHSRCLQATVCSTTDAQTLISTGGVAAP
mmetsp:Transcript_122718/g.238662  ORF Transcript_122718/g.238662 Transcript_122718/m.238662 type:complete len:225 (+) Transcript_122718:935-1609(+)